MKNSLKFFVVFCCAIVHTTFAQNINLKFTGSTPDGKYVQLDSVRVENLNRSWTETLVYPDTVLMLTDETGISEWENNSFKCLAYPNPCNGKTNVFLTLAQDEIVTMQMYNLAGQCMMEKQVQAEAGENHFKINLDHPQVYFLIVQTAHGKLVQKLINTSHSGDNGIAYIGNQGVNIAKTQKLLSSKPFRTGDVLRMTGYVTLNGNIVNSNEILQSQAISENFILSFTLQNNSLPTLTTIAVSNITSATAASGGNVSNDGGSSVIARGICWSTIPNPTTSDNHTFDGSGTGSFTSSITGLTASTTYYVRAYAANSVGTAYGNQVAFTTTAMLPTLTTTAVSSITDSSAVSGGNITSDGGATIIARGVCWDTTHNPTISSSHTTDGFGTGSFTSNIIGLTAGTTYYVRAYAANSAGTAYGSEVTFTSSGMSSDALFSVSATTRVVFSPGNLQWSPTNGGNSPTTHVVAANGRPAAGTWRFAPNQWDTIGAGNSNISSTYTGWIDLFGWGTSGSRQQPYKTSTTSVDYGVYGDMNNHISGTYYDWGVYNAIYNPQTNTTDAPGTWRTLSSSEWTYLLNTRTTTSGIRYAKGNVHGVNGLIIVPDNWSSSIYTLDSTNTYNATYFSNIINSTDWAEMEAAGCVFLPAAGSRNGTSVSNVGSGYYWSATSYGTVNYDDSGSGYAYQLIFTSITLNSYSTTRRNYGFSVRLVTTVW